MGRKKVHWNYLRLGLHKKASPPIDSRVRRKGVEGVRPQTPGKQDQPYPSDPNRYGAKKQYATQQSTTPLLDKNVKNTFRKYVENYYFLGEQYTAHCCALSVPVNNNHHNQQKTQ